MLFRRRERAQSHEDAARIKIAELTQSRRTIVDAYEIERRRIERDLHDGTQQYLVAAAMKIGEAKMAPGVQHDPHLAALLHEAHDAINEGLASLRATVRGIHPQVLAELGLRQAVEDVAAASGSDVRVVCPHELPSMPEGVVAAAYFFACEAMANAAKYAPGASVTVLLSADANLRVSVVDLGPGGARVVPGHGLAGMKERLVAFGGTLDISSPDGGPTQLLATIPLLLEQGQPGVSL